MKTTKLFKKMLLMAVVFSLTFHVVLAMEEEFEPSLSLRKGSVPEKQSSNAFSHSSQQWQKARRKILGNALIIY